jgi:hypothetical protein
MPLSFACNVIHLHGANSWKHEIKKDVLIFFMVPRGATNYVTLIRLLAAEGYFGH